MGFFSGLASFLTGGVSDIVQGDPWGAGFNESLGGLAAFISPPTATVNRTVEGIKAGDYMSALHNALTFSPQIDDSLTELGSWANKESGGDSGKFMDIAAPVVGTIWGPWGTTIGAQVAGRWSKDYRGQSEADIQKKTAMTGATSWAGSAVGDLLGGASGGASSPTYDTGSFSDYTSLADSTGQAYQPTFYEPIASEFTGNAASTAGQGAGLYSAMSTTPDLSTGLLADASRTWNEIPQPIKDVGEGILKSSGKAAYNNFMSSMMGTPQGFVPQEAPPPLPNWRGGESTKSELGSEFKPSSLAPSEVKFTPGELEAKNLAFDYTKEYKSISEKEKEEKKKKEEDKDWLGKYSKDNSYYNYLA